MIKNRREREERRARVREKEFKQFRLYGITKMQIISI